MKKVLFATTALIATAGVASADITLTGSANMGIKSPATVGADSYLHNEIDFNIVASTTTDNGYTVGASLDIDDGTEETSGLGTVSDSEVYISGAFGTITTGDVSNAADGVGLADVGFDDLGVDDDIEALDTLGSADIVYSGSFNGVGVTLSYNMGVTSAVDANEGDWGAMVSFDVNGLGVKAAYTVDDSATTNDNAAALQLSYNLGGIGLGAYFADNGVNGGNGFSASYALDANTTITGVWAQTDEANNKDDFGIGFSTSLGGGVSLAGGVGRVDGTQGTTETAMDLGINMTF